MDQGGIWASGEGPGPEQETTKKQILAPSEAELFNKTVIHCRYASRGGVVTEGVQESDGGAEEAAGTLTKVLDSPTCGPVMRAQMPRAAQVLAVLNPAKKGSFRQLDPLNQQLHQVPASYFMVELKNSSETQGHPCPVRVQLSCQFCIPN